MKSALMFLVLGLSLNSFAARSDYEISQDHAAIQENAVVIAAFKGQEIQIKLVGEADGGDRALYTVEGVDCSAAVSVITSYPVPRHNEMTAKDSKVLSLACK